MIRFEISRSFVHQLITDTQIKDKLTLLFELLEDVPPFAADDVETVIEGVTLELYKKRA